MDLIDGSIGELSPFHATFGYYAQAVAPETAVLPKGWDRRVNRVIDPISHAEGLCIDPGVSPRQSWSPGARRIVSLWRRCFRSESSMWKRYVRG